MKTRQVLELLRAFESRNVTRIDEEQCTPIVWSRAKGSHVWDAEGKKYIDLTAAFGVAAAGHANPRVVAAAKRQMVQLLHAMGDVFPHEQKAKLARELSRITYEKWVSSGRLTGKTIFCNSGFEAVEAALKTALLATGNPGIIAFKGAYHGLGYGALNATHRKHFREPFSSQLRAFGHFATFPTVATDESEEAVIKRCENEARTIFRREKIGAVLVEPVQVRGGINIPPLGFLPMLRALCAEHKSLLILDEIYTGFGRTGKWFACEHSETIPDIICLGKALTGGFPLSACVGRADVMDRAWPVSSGEAIHTSTFLGHPVGCAMALAQIKEIEMKHLVEKSERLGKWLQDALLQLNCTVRSEKRNFVFRFRGQGLLAGIEISDINGKPATRLSLKIINEILRRGFILLPEGEYSNVVSFTPPLTITRKQLAEAVHAIEGAVKP